MESGYIYRLTLNKDIEGFNKGEIYIGKHNGKRSKTYFSGGRLVQNIVKKYGKNVFDREIMCRDIDDEVISQYLEVYYINKYKCNRYKSGIGLNLTDGGEGVRGNVMSEETKEKFRKTMLENYKTGRLTPPRCKPVYSYNLETGKLVKEYKSIKDASLEMKCDRASIQTAAIKDGSCKNLAWDYNKLDEKIIDAKGKVRVLQYDPEGNLIKEWLSSKDAATFLNVSPCSITNCCRGRSKTSHGFKWKWKSDKKKIKTEEK